MYNYVIKNYKRFRRKTEYIIITHARNLIENFYIDPVVIQGSRHYTWGIWQRYWLDDLKKPALPCHYFMEYLDKDYVIYTGLYDFQPSYYIEDMVSAGIIDYKYLNSMLIIVGDDFSINTVERRMSEHLSDKVLTGLLRTYELDFTRIKYIDDCLKPEWKENLQNSVLEYKYEPAKYFDFQVIKGDLDKYKKR
jgi:esterase/lipase superfamily enzyme